MPTIIRSVPFGVDPSKDFLEAQKARRMASFRASVRDHFKFKRAFNDGWDYMELGGRLIRALHQRLAQATYTPGG